MQDQNPALRGFSQEDSYKIAREDGTGWDTSKAVFFQICRHIPDFDRALQVAEEWDEENEPPWGAELRYQVTRIWNIVSSGEPQSFGGLPSRRLQRPEVLDYARCERIVAKYGPGTEKKIRNASKRCPNAANALDFLFPNNPWIAASWQSVNDQQTYQREAIRGHESRYAWLSPNPFKQKQVKINGNWSMRCDANVRARLHLVVEFDLKERHGWGPSLKAWAAAGLSALDVHGALFLWIAATASLKPFMVVFSGSVSYHAWYDVRGLTEDQCADLVQLTLPLGGDPAALVPSQLFRMPGGTRLRRINDKITRVRQEVVFWNPYKT